MIVFGTRSKVSPGKEIRQAVCASCGNAGINTYTAHRYFHIYWIPFLPFKRQLCTECQHCKEAHVGKEIPSEYLSVAGTDAGAGRPPWYLFSGLVLLIALGIYGQQANQRDKQETASFLNAPQVNDLYIVTAEDVFGEKPEKGKYTVLLVQAVNGEKLDFVPARYLYSTVSKAEKDIRNGSAREGEYFANSVLGFDKTAIGKFHADNAIRKIIRNTQ